MWRNMGFYWIILSGFPHVVKFHKRKFGCGGYRVGDSTVEYNVAAYCNNLGASKKYWSQGLSPGCGLGTGNSNVSLL